jgi:hypothetical protein
MTEEYGPITEQLEALQDEVLMDKSLLENLSRIIDERRHSGLIFVLIGAWGTGKSTYGQLIAEQFDGNFLDGDKDYEKINQLFSNGVKKNQLTVVSASFAEGWMDKETRDQMIQDGNLVYINLVASEDTRRTNFYMRREGKVDVSEILRWKQQSPNYIFDGAEFIVDVSLEKRTNIDDLRSLIRSVMLGG